MPDLRVSFPEPCDEKWEAMAPADRARICARCDKAVHDLSRYTFDEAEALLRQSPDTCVRARIDNDGAVLLKRSRRADARRMVMAVAATASLLAASAPALAKEERPSGAIRGIVEVSGFSVQVTATDADGRTFRTRAKGKGRFRIKHLPAGTYRLSFVPDCGGSEMTIERVVVGDGETIVPDVRGKDEDRCIVVGLLRIEKDRG